MNSHSPIDLPGGFAAARRRILDHVWRDDFSVTEIPAPTRIAPDSMAVDAIVKDAEQADRSGGQGEHPRDLGQGRLIILHDPSAPDSWQGTTRLVTVVRADVDAEMATDPLLAEVSRSWLTDGLDSLQARYTCLAGTATSVVSRPFGNLSDQPQENRIELRASWSPLIDDATQLDDHLDAWQDLLCHICGLPPIIEGVVTLKPRHRRAADL
ncbi:MAG: DUF3000 domain-containing protein [Acidipropionibacterium sp.]|nr:DUF3000 domain-containing protein [Acidipropionibacterium sp.]